MQDQTGDSYSALGERCLANTWKLKLAEAGWYYAPTDESDDMAICAYCHLALDGWENTDIPQ